MSDDYNDVEYVGTVAALVEKKAGWHTVEIHVPGKQYPVKADTKLEPLLKQAREVRDAGLVSTFVVRESESENINPNTSRPYTERRLEKIEAGAQNQANANASPTSTAPQDGGSGGMTKEEWRRKDRAADRRALIAIAVSALSHTMPSDPSTEDLNKFNERVKYLSRGWHLQVEAVRNEDDSDAPFLSEHDDAIPY